ncbi:MAG TPA: cytidylate kinase family protein [Thermodesulfobacteriota bacterium]|nr:cytidylate kinase family protein [Thermodesulfobacteriota bacterium]
MHLITFSRKMGANGSEIAKQVAEKMGYKFYDTAAIEDAAQEMGILESVKEIDEKAPPLFQRFFSHRPAIDLDRLDSVVYELARQGDAVFLGRGSQILLKSFYCALHVRVTASVEKRVENLMKRGFHREAALKAIERSDHERGAFIKFAFGVDWENPDLYDVVLNMDKISVKIAVSTVLGIGRSEEIKACSIDAIQSLEKMGLERRVEAALIEAGLTYGPTTSISVSVDEPGKVGLIGVVEDQAGKVKAEKLAKGLKGVVSVDNQIRVIPADRHA